ncbi:MAG: cytochrome c-type biogenesis protein [Acidimicrobiales bacterium]
MTLSRRAVRGAWVLIAVVLALSLVVGAQHRAPAPSPVQRAAAIDAVVKCPSCEGISVAQSSASTAVAIRTLVRQRIAAGQSDAQIEQFLVDRYGQGILLRPPLRGATGTVWLVPAVALALALGALGRVFWRRRRVVAGAVSDEDRDLVAGALSAHISGPPRGDA